MTLPAGFGSGSVQSIESPIVWEEQRSSSRPLQWKSQPAGPGVCRLDGEMVALLAILACWSGVWWSIGVTQIQFKIVQRVRSVQFA